jgi:hypothetical protein
MSCMRITPTRGFALAIVICAAAFVGWRGYEKRELEDRLGAIATEIAGRHVRVHCQGMFGAALDVTGESGSVMFGPDGRPASVTELKRDVCRRLDRYRHEHGSAKFTCAANGTRCTMDTVKSLHALQTLAHESWHLEGQRSEAITECYALQTTAEVAERLGATPPEGQSAARAVSTLLYPRMPPEYQTRDCHDGGPLDLHPGSSLWP